MSRNLMACKECGEWSVFHLVRGRWVVVTHGCRPNCSQAEESLEMRYARAVRGGMSNVAELLRRLESYFVALHHGQVPQDGSPALLAGVRNALAQMEA